MSGAQELADRLAAYLDGNAAAVAADELSGYALEPGDYGLLVCVIAVASWYEQQDTPAELVAMLVERTLDHDAAAGRHRSLFDKVMADLALDQDGRAARKALDQFRGGYDRAALDNAITVLRRFRAGGGGRLAIRPACLTLLMMALWLRWQDSGSHSDLDEVVAIGEEENERLPDQGRGLWAAAIRERAQRDGQAVDMDRLRATGAPEHAHRELRAQCLLLLRDARAAAYQRTREPEHLDEVIRLSTMALEHSRGDARAPLFDARATALSERYRLSGSKEDRDASITARRSERLQYAEHHDDWLLASIALREALQERRQTGDEVPADLDELIRINADLLDHPAIEGHDRDALLSQQTDLLWERSKGGLSEDDLGKAVAVGRELERRIGDTDPGRLSSLGHLLFLWFQRTGDREALEQAIAFGRRSIRAGQQSAREQGRRLSNLFVAQLTLAENTGEAEDFDAAIDTALNAVGLVDQGAPEGTPHLVNLASAYSARFLRFGAEDDLDRSIRHGGEAVRTAGDEQSRLEAGAILVASLALRLDRFDDLSALDKAVELLGQGWSVDAAWLQSIRVLAEVVGRRTEDLSLDQGLHPALLHACEKGLLLAAVELMDTGSQLRNLALIDIALDSLATAEALGTSASPAVYPGLRGLILIRRWQISGIRTELDQAIDLLLEAADDEEAPDLAREHLDEAARALYRRFRRRRRIADLEEAGRQMERCLALTPQDHERRPRMSEFLRGVESHLRHPPTALVQVEVGAEDGEDLHSPHGMATVNTWNRGEALRSGLDWTSAADYGAGPSADCESSGLRVLFLRTFTADDVSHSVLTSLALALDGGPGRIEIVGDQRDRSALEESWEAAFGTRAPEDRIDFVSSTREDWRKEILRRMTHADAVVLHLSPKDTDFLEFPFGPPATGGGDDMWDRFMDAPFSRPITGPGLLREVSYLNRTGKLPATVVLCDDRHRQSLEDVIALSGVLGDATDVAGNFITPRLTAIDKQVGHLRKAFRAISYTRPDGAPVMSDLAAALRRTLADLAAGPATAEATPWRPEDLWGRSTEPRRLPPDNSQKIIAFSDVESVLFLPRGEITEIGAADMLSVLSREAIDTGCPYCRAPVDRMFFYVLGLWPSEELDRNGAPHIRAKCQVCGHKSSQWDGDTLMPQ
ncbi:hypothetical protein ACFV23_18025 [Streptomyces sp. NPDC059627]